MCGGNSAADAASGGDSVAASNRDALAIRGSWALLGFQPHADDPGVSPGGCINAVAARLSGIGWERGDRFHRFYGDPRNVHRFGGGSDYRRRTGSDKTTQESLTRKFGWDYA